MKRRSFIKSSTAAAFGFQVVPSHVVRAADGGNLPNDKIRIAAIGVGGQGGADLGGMQSEDIVALCDVDDNRAAGSYKKFPKARRFKDFRKMLDVMDKDCDAVLVATPDHTHAVAVMAALERGKHVYCEKPLAHSISEVRALRAKALEKKVITQVGNQGHSSGSIRTFCELIWSDAIGKVTEVHAGCDAFKNVYCQIPKMKEFKVAHEVPESLDWDLWLGPAKERPYNPGYMPFTWRGHGPFGSGCLGDWVCHVLDPIYWACDLGMPTAVTAETKGYDKKIHGDFFPQGTRITFEFAAGKYNKPMKVIWHDGDSTIPRPKDLEPERKKWLKTGAVVTGEKGQIMHGSHGAGGVRLIPEAKAQEFGKPEEKIARLKGGHQKDWLDSIRAGKQAGSNFEYGGAITEIGLLGVIAIRLSGERLEWDAKNMKFTNNEAANKLVHHHYREGWKI